MSDVTQELVLDERLAGELRRRGIQVHAGNRVRLQLVSKQEHDDHEIAAWEAFVGGFTSGESDLADRSEDILRAELPRDLDYPDQLSETGRSAVRVAL